MAISTKNKPEDKKAKLQELKDYHLATFERHGITDPLFVGSMAYKPTGKDSKYISFFPSQLKKGQDIYTEFTNKDLVPEDPNRTLYKWRFNEYWQEEYETVEIENSTDFRYLVPVEELTIVPKPVIKSSSPEIISFEKFDEIMDPDMDCPLDQITLRDLAAIFLIKPVSRKKWLNDIINK